MNGKARICINQGSVKYFSLDWIAFILFWALQGFTQGPVLSCRYQLPARSHMLNKERLYVRGALIHHLSSLIMVAPEIAGPAERLLIKAISSLQFGKKSMDTLTSRRPQHTFAQTG